MTTTDRLLRLVWATLVIGALTFLMVGCGYGGTVPGHTPQADCSGPVTLHVVNDHSADIQVTFPGDTQRRIAGGLDKTTWQVPRYKLRYGVALSIARGGLQIGGPEIVDTGVVECSDATLHIGTALWNSFFFGVKLPLVDR